MSIVMRLLPESTTRARPPEHGTTEHGSIHSWHAAAGGLVVHAPLTSANVLTTYASGRSGIKDRTSSHSSSGSIGKVA